MIEKASQGNEQAYRIIVETYRNHVFRTIYSVIRNERDAEEAAQEVFVKVFYSLSQYKKQGFKTWLTRIALNYAIDLKRKAASRREQLQETEIEQADRQAVEEEFLRKETREIVQKRLQEIPANYRDVIVAFYLQEKSYQEIATEQQVEVKTIETKLYRARKWLQKHWKEEDFR